LASDRCRFADGDHRDRGHPSKQRQISCYLSPVQPQLWPQDRCRLALRLRLGVAHPDRGIRGTVGGVSIRSAAIHLHRDRTKADRRPAYTKPSGMGRVSQPMHVDSMRRGMVPRRNTYRRVQTLHCSRQRSAKRVRNPAAPPENSRPNLRPRNKSCRCPIRVRAGGATRCKQAGIWVLTGLMFDPGAPTRHRTSRSLSVLVSLPSDPCRPGFAGWTEGDLLR
jgi:hypothetical protein